MLRTTKRSKIEVVATEEEKELPHVLTDLREIRIEVSS
jgi:hypothetical protein